MPFPSPTTSNGLVSHLSLFLSSGEETANEKRFLRDYVNNHVNPRIRRFQLSLDPYDSRIHTFDIPQGDIKHLYLDPLSQSNLCAILLGTGPVGPGTLQELRMAVNLASKTPLGWFKAIVLKKEGAPTSVPGNIHHRSTPIATIETQFKEKLIWLPYSLDPTHEFYFRETMATHLWELAAESIHRLRQEGNL